MTRLGALDRKVGNHIRSTVAGRAEPARALALAARALSPVFRGVVALLVILPRERRIGVRAGFAATVAALLAGRLRRLIGRPRPVDGAPGFPSRHAAASAAIVTTVARARPGLGAILGVVALVGVTGRITSGRHDPADIASGAVLGYATAVTVRRLTEDGAA